MTIAGGGSSQLLAEPLPSLAVEGTRQRIAQRANPVVMIESNNFLEQELLRRLGAQGFRNEIAVGLPQQWKIELRAAGARSAESPRLQKVTAVPNVDSAEKKIGPAGRFMSSYSTKFRSMALNSR